MSRERASDGWDQSAAAWIADVGDHGDFGRRYVLDPPMKARIVGRGFKDALDVGCGEGRFCRWLRSEGIAATGIDPTAALLAEARRRDPESRYEPGRAEALPFADASFDLVVSYLSLIDIPTLAPAIAEMARVLRPGGTLLIANLNSFSTAAAPSGNRAARGLPPTGWVKDSRGRGLVFGIDDYLGERAEWVEWRGIRIRNWHRPLSTYMTLLLNAGLELRHFAEPAPIPEAETMQAERYRRVPWFVLMEWQQREA